MTRFEGGGELEGTTELDYEQALEALLSLIGRPVLLLLSGADGPPFIAAVIAGRLGRCAINLLAGGELGQSLER